MPPRCPITYEELNPEEAGPYSRQGLKHLDRNLRALEDLPLGAEELRREAARRAAKMSIQGFQPKLSAVLRVTRGTFEIVDTGGRWILKPQSQMFRELPENEDLTMHLAAVAGMPVPVHGLIRSGDGSWTYAVERFDRGTRGKRLALEDFAQLSGEIRDTKYASSMEAVGKVVEEFTTFPRVQSIRLFKLTLFSFLVGNEDMHLKNFSLITKPEGQVELSPAYDLVNSTIALEGAQEEMALPIHGRKRKLSRDDLVSYYGSERLGLNDAVIEFTLRELESAGPAWDALIEASFLSDAAKDAYRAVVADRRTRLFGRSA